MAGHAAEKLQAPQEEAQKQTPARGTTTANPAPSRRREKKTQLRRPRKDPHTNAGTTSEEVRSENPHGQLPQVMA